MACTHIHMNLSVQYHGLGLGLGLYFENLYYICIVLLLTWFSSIVSPQHTLYYMLCIPYCSTHTLYICTAHTFA